MKIAMIFMAIAYLLLLQGCRKNDSSGYTDGKGMVGKWKAEEQFRSPGSGGEWYPLSYAERFTIEFKADSSFSFSSDFPMSAASFDRFSRNGYQVKMFSLLTNETANWYLGDTVINNEMSLAVFLCIEGCPYKLRRIK